MSWTRYLLVTGCASGIGRHLVGAAARRGHSVLATDRAVEALEQAARVEDWPPHRIHTRALDVTDPAAWEGAVAEALERFGALDVLLNVAGVLQPGWIHEVEASQVDLHVDVNIKGTIHGTRVAAAAMVSRGRGHIVNIASLAGVAPIPGLSLYSASKFAVRGFSLAAAEELSEHGVHVSVLCPDAVQTPMLDKQRGYEEAALTFSGSRALTVQELEHAVFEDILKGRPRELLIPFGRGLMAKVASAFPGLASALRPMLVRRGKARQSRS
jgi:3-oxoacyl-[acyl-carrier protein] reductase